MAVQKTSPVTVGMLSNLVPDELRLTLSPDYWNTLRSFLTATPKRAAYINKLKKELKKQKQDENIEQHLARVLSGCMHPEPLIPNPERIDQQLMNHLYEILNK